MKCPGLAASMCSLCLLLPWVAVADSGVAPGSGSAAGAAHASTHLDFKIVVPGVLSLELPARQGTVQAGRMAIGTNRRNVALGCRARGGTRRDVVLGAPARGTVAEQESVPVPDMMRPVPVTCTVAMP